MASKAPHGNNTIELPRYPTIPTIDFEELERAQIRGRELQGEAVRDAFSALFQAAAGLLSGTRPTKHEGRKDTPLVASNPG